MLRDVVYSLFLISFSNLGMAASQQGACPSRLEADSLKIVDSVQTDKSFQSFMAESIQKREAVLESKEFQETVSLIKEKVLRAQGPSQVSQLKHHSESTNSTELTIFVSFSLGEKALLNLAKEAKLYGATLVLRGFKDNSYAQTVKALQNIIQETGQGFIIDPELFSLFSVTTVPTTVLSRSFQLNTLERTQTMPPDRVEGRLSGVRPGGLIHDRLHCHVSLHYALEQFAKEGDLQKEALSLLEKARKGGLQ